MARNLIYAGFWIRVWATVMDSLLLASITLPLILSIYGEAYFLRETLMPAPAEFLITYVLPAVAIILFWLYKQATLGKMAIAATIVDAQTGGKPSAGQLVGRYFAYFVSILPLGLGIIWVAFDARKQGWHDKLACTVVVRRRPRGVQPVAFEAAFDAERERGRAEGD